MFYRRLSPELAQAVGVGTSTRFAVSIFGGQERDDQNGNQQHASKSQTMVCLHG